MASGKREQETGQYDWSLDGRTDLDGGEGERLPPPASSTNPAVFAPSMYDPFSALMLDSGETSKKETSPV